MSLTFLIGFGQIIPPAFIANIKISWSDDAYDHLDAAAARYPNVPTSILKAATEEIAFRSARRLGARWVQIRCSFHDETRVTNMATEIRSRVKDGRHITLRMGEPKMSAHVYVDRTQWEEGKFEIVGEGVVLSHGDGEISQSLSTGIFRYDSTGNPA
ncbi:uncharacterized protein N7511_003106 [Penicillium nucicola]|uniref:uncharacterized protein n=1 Tax=Penicillium nucicola TaxID=1850975 RepID=UPI002545B0FE|nr:uncharacterized protein N7511_003106 [Penicillium nucicola]KAJ5771055.1 hypothetical protein N7511_003106 [Penicillium nucicola]